MRFLVTCDLHIKEENLQVGRELLDSIEKTAFREACPIIILIGDVWDEKHIPPFKVLMAIRNAILRWCSLNLQVIWIRGNHEVGIKSKPEESYIKLFEGIDYRLQIVNTPTTRVFDDVCLWMLPWYPPEEFKHYANEFKIQTKQAMWARSKILLSHIGLSGAQTSPSNVYTLNSKTSIHDLYANHYDYVLLGDIHITQYLANNTLYCGCPIQLTFGDKPNQGLYVLDCSLGGGILTNVPLEGQGNFPQYKTFEILYEHQFYTLTEPDHNYVKLKVDVNLMGAAHQVLKQKHNRRWSVEPLPLAKIKESKGRMVNIKENETEKILDLWLDSKGFTDTQIFKEVGLKYMINTGLFHKK